MAIEIQTGNVVVENERSFGCLLVVGEDQETGALVNEEAEEGDDECRHSNQGIHLPPTVYRTPQLEAPQHIRENWMITPGAWLQLLPR